MTTVTTTSPTLESLSIRYVTDRTRRGRFRGETPRKVTHILLAFAESVGPDLPATSLTRRKLETWAGSLSVAPSTARHRISTVRAFCHWLATEDHIRNDPARSLETPRVPRSIPRGMKTDAVAALYSVLPDARAELIVSLMVQEGLRCKEVSGLQLGDVDLADNMIFISEGKGGHQRFLALTTETRRALDNYLAQHPASQGPLIRGYESFTGRSTFAPISPGTISKYVSRWMDQAHLKTFPKDGVSAHALRHTAATDMLRGGAHLRDVQAVLGHSSLATTQKYLPAIVHDIRIAMEGREYRRGSVPVSKGADDPVPCPSSSPSAPSTP